MTKYKLIVHLRDSDTIEFYVYDKVPATSGHNLIVWATVDGGFYIVNEADVIYVECEVGGDE